MTVVKQVGAFLSHEHVQSSERQDEEFTLMGEISDVR